MCRLTVLAFLSYDYNVLCNDFVLFLWSCVEKSLLFKKQCDVKKWKIIIIKKKEQKNTSFFSVTKPNGTTYVCVWERARESSNLKTLALNDICAHLHLINNQTLLARTDPHTQSAVRVHCCCLTSTETVRTIRGGKSKATTSNFTRPLSSDKVQVQWCFNPRDHKAY